MTERDFKIFLNIPVLKTERLVLRKILKTDLSDVYDYASRPKVSEYLLWSAHKSVEQTKIYLANLSSKYKKGKLYDWGIEYEGKIIGTVGFTSLDLYNNSGEIGYVLSDKYWRLGIGREAAEKILSFGFRVLCLNRIEARYMTDNTASIALAKKLGMKPEGVMRKSVFCKGRYVDIGISSILAEEYLKTRPNIM